MHIAGLSKFNQPLVITQRNLMVVQLMHFTMLVTFNGINTFFDNSAQYNSGGAIYAETNSSLIFNGISDFNYRELSRPWGWCAKANSQLSFIGTSDFSHNSADYGLSKVLPASFSCWLPVQAVTAFGERVGVTDWQRWPRVLVPVLANRALQ